MAIEIWLFGRFRLLASLMRDSSVGGVRGANVMVSEAITTIAIRIAMVMAVLGLPRFFIILLE
jgi:hypothetical protein